MKRVNEDANDLIQCQRVSDDGPGYFRVSSFPVL
jgi:hypothetical protein